MPASTSDPTEVRAVQNHYLSLLAPALREHADKPLFRPYVRDTGRWDTVTYRDFEKRLVLAQARWRPILAGVPLRPLDIVGVWLTGYKFTDLVNSIAISSLGYTPQFFSGYFSSASVVVELLVKGGGKVLVIDGAFKNDLSATADTASHVQVLSALDDGDLLQDLSAAEKDGSDGSLSFVPDAAVGLDDHAALFHSSGTTGGMPKIIPNTHKMMRSIILHKHAGAQDSDNRSLVSGGVHTVTNTPGRLVHVASFHTFLGVAYTGACMAQTSSMAISPEEFMGLVHECGLTRLILYATYLSDIIRVAKDNTVVRDALKGLRQIIHTGVALNKEDEEWAYAHGLRLVTTYSTSETGPLLRSLIGTDPSSRLLYPVSGANPVFVPYQDPDSSGSGTGEQNLYEVVVPATAYDCPPPPFISDDGYYHTNDIFEKVEDGWIYRGRAGDWIKTLGGFVDTKNIEDNVRKTCADVVHDAVVVGSGRDAACLVVESNEIGLDGERKQALARLVAERMADFNKRLFLHERINDPKRILVVDRGTLPRTKEKRNVRRNATEELLSKEIDAALAAV